MRVLLVKLSSLGDVIHNLPVVSDLARARPDIEIDWVSEAPYIPLIELHPAVRGAFPIHLRHLKKNWWSPAAWGALHGESMRVRLSHYDRVLDTQGLLKSAWVARWAKAPITGFAADSARESLATRFYAQSFEVARDQHAVTRNRQLAARAFDYQAPDAIDYGLRIPTTVPAGLPADRYVVFLHATSRADKMWPAGHWKALGENLRTHGLKIVLPWGNEAEKSVSRQLAATLSNAIVPPALSLVEAAAMLAHADAVVGVDTGLAHLAVALRRPTVGLYLTTSQRLTGLIGGAHAVNLGDGSRERPDCPTVDAVWNALTPWLAQGREG